MKSVSNTVKVTEDLYCLGPPFLPVYLYDGEEPVVFDAGMSVMAEHYEAEIKKILGDRGPKYLLLSHMHFDHCGAAGYLKSVFPDMTICSAQAGAETIQKPSALKLIRELSYIPNLSENLLFKDFTVDRVLSGGEILTLSDGKKIEIIATPGHTRDMLSYYLPELKALFPSEAAGVPTGNEYIYTEFLVDCERYLESLKVLAQYEVEFILFAHNFFYSAADTSGFFESAIRQSIQFRDRIGGLLDEYGTDLEAVKKIIKAEEYDPITEAKQPEPAYLINLQAKVNAVVRWRENS